MIKTERTGTTFDYMLLGRLQVDCEYFLGWGNRNEEKLWAGNVKEQLEEMSRLWKKCKPQWLTRRKLNYYKRKMMNNGGENE